MIDLRCYGAFFLMSASMAYANATLPASYLGLDTLDTINYSSGSSCVSVNGVACGGEFTGTLGMGTANTKPIAVNFWCVDSQEDFYFGQNGLAEVVPLSSIATNSANVSYSQVGTSGGGTWTNTTVVTPEGTVTLASDATTRYEMAAYLVSQFPGFDLSVNGGSPKATAIEGAIWDIMSNNTPSENPFSYFPVPSGAPGPNDVDYWIYQASLASNYDTTSSDFAVISWVANSSGGLQNSTGHNAQTFLVEYTPEPGLYGALTVGLTGLLFTIRRRRKLKENLVSL